LTTPRAIDAAASPAIVASTIYEKVLFVPVEIGIIGVSPTTLATILFVPSPPITIITSHSSFIILAASYVSSQLSHVFISINSTLTLILPRE